jgi:hypothetical protein
MVFAPLPLTLWSTCGIREEREVIAFLKAAHMSASIVYVIFALGQHWSILTTASDNGNNDPGAGIAGGMKGRRRWKSEGTEKYRHFCFDVLSLGGMVAEFVALPPDDTRGYQLREASWAHALTLLLYFRGWRVFVGTGARVMGYAAQVSELFVWLIFMGHAAACFFLRLALEGHALHRTTWADSLLFQDQWSCVDLYTSALYFCTYTLTSIGYGDLVPGNALEHVFCVMFMLGSQMIAAKIFADLTWLTATHQHWKAQSHAHMMQTSAALQGLGVNPHLRERVYAYQDFIFKKPEQRTEDILGKLSRPLAEELKFEVYYDLVQRAAFLQEQPTHIVRVIISSLTDLVYLPCDVIIRRGDMGTDLFFLREGHAGVFRTQEMPEWSDQEIHVLKNGAYFGEIALLTGQPRQSWVVARTYCVCSLLPKHVIDEVMTAHPACLTALVNSLKGVLGLKSLTTWQDVLEKIRAEFKDTDRLFDFVCGKDSAAASGVFTWRRWEGLMQRLFVPTLDAKLMWAALDVSYKGSVMFTQFVDKVKTENNISPSKDMCSTRDLHAPPPGRSHSSKSLKSVKSEPVKSEPATRSQSSTSYRHDPGGQPLRHDARRRTSSPKVAPGWRLDPQASPRRTPPESRSPNGGVRSTSSSEFRGTHGAPRGQQQVKIAAKFDTAPGGPSPSTVHSLAAGHPDEVLLGMAAQMEALAAEVRAALASNDHRQRLRAPISGTALPSVASNQALSDGRDADVDAATAGTGDLAVEPLRGSEPGTLVSLSGEHS